MTQHPPSAPRPLAADWLVGGGEMGALIRAKDWASTPLGPIEGWPQSLRSAVSILLPSKAQIVLFWGPDLVAIYNDAYRPVFGAKHPTALGMPARDCWREVWDVLEPLFQNVVTTGEAFWAKDHLFGLERHGYVEETYFDVSYDPVRDETGRVGGIFCIVSETTGRIIGQRRLAALRDLGRIGHDARSEGDVFRNAAAVLERARQDVPFAALYSWNPSREAADLEAVAGIEAGAPGAPRGLVPNQVDPWPLDGNADLVLARPHRGPLLPGGPWPEAVTQAAVLRIGPPGTEPLGYLVAGISPRRQFDDDYGAYLRLLASNIASAVAGVRALEDERKRVAELAELDRAKTTFFSNVSHEFRTPLTLILGPIGDLLARSDGTLQPQDLALLGSAQRNGQRLLKLVNTLLDFARIEAGRTQASYQPTDLSELTTDLVSNFLSACERAGIRLTVDCPPLAETIYVDREMWEQIVLNLLSNAFKFTLEGGISVRLQDVGALVELVVSDTGGGIPAESVSRVFERFHRAEHTRGRSHEGSGIGLALVSELVKLHGGTIEVSSQLGEGSTFTVAIPKGSAHLPAIQVVTSTGGAIAKPSRASAYVAEALGWLPNTETTPAASRPPDALRILVADDNADLREYVRKLLAEDYDVDAVADGQAALESARRRPPNLILSDVMMPRLDGFELIRAVRADPALAMIPVILLSARAGEEARIEGLGKGADDYLVKPFSSRELQVRVATLLRSAEMHRRVGEVLREADRRKDEFLATLAHELRNPLAPLRSSLEVLKMGRGDRPPANAALEIMERQVTHLVRLVDDLMEVSRITRGDVELRREPVSLEMALHNAIESSEPLIHAGGHRLTVSMPKSPIVLDADPVRLAQIFGNLLNNAAKYSDRDATITVAAWRESGEAVVTISDTGDGIEAEQLPQLFKVFARGQRGVNRNQSGLGIGLALVRRLTELHGGRVTAESPGIGKGSRFTVRLPIPASQQMASGEVAASSRAVAPIRILVVDDNRDAAESLGALLEMAGAEIRVAHDGAQALTTFADCRPHMVLLDIGMPGMDGYEVARRLRATAQEPRAAIVAVSGWGQQEDRQRARDAGFDHHLVKPANLEVLQALIEDIRAGENQES